MKLSAEFCSEIRVTRDSAVNRVHVEAWKPVVKGSVEERVVAKILRKGAGEVEIETTVGPLFDDFDVYMLLLPMAVDFVLWSGKAPASVMTAKVKKNKTSAAKTSAAKTSAAKSYVVLGRHVLANGRQLLLAGDVPIPKRTIASSTCLVGYSSSAPC